MKAVIDYREPAASGLKKSLLALAVGAALSHSALAEDAILPTVTVTGQAASMDSALDVQQMADNILSVVHADGIGQLPDNNAAEALQRIPGLSVERDQGEGRYVKVRGLGADLNAVTINGSVVPSPESGRRAVQLDVLPAALIRSLEVSKTLMPSQDANSIGGTVEIKTVSAFDHPGQFYTLEAGANYDTKLKSTQPNYTGVWSNRLLDGKLGIAIGYTSSTREFGSDNVETGGTKWNFDNGKLSEFQRRDYTITRERQGGIFNIEYRPEAGESYYLRSLVSHYSDEETRQRQNVTFSSAVAEGALTSTNKSSRELKYRTETENIHSFVLGGERKLGDWEAAASIGYSKSDQDTPDAISSAKFTSSTSYLVGYSGTSQPILIGSSAINNATGYKLSSIKLASQYTDDEETNFKLDLGRKLQIFGIDSEFKFGGKSSQRRKNNDQTAWSISGSALGSPTLASLSSGTVDYAYGDFGPAISSSAIKNLISTVNRNNYIDQSGSTINDFTMTENIDAAYLQNTFNSGLWRILAGVRYEGTHFNAKGTGLNGASFVATEADRKYGNILPAVHLRRDLDNDTAIRAAWTNSVVRPTFGQLAPGYSIVGSEATFGNPNLKAAKSANFDLGIEHRLGYAGVLSAYVFHKDIKDFAYATDLAGSGEWSAYTLASTYANGRQARVNGLELAYAQSFQHLPAPWNGLLLSANATFVDSSAEVAGLGTTRNVPLPGQSKQSANLMLGYESGPWNLRLAINYQSAYLDSITKIADERGDLYVAPQTMVDFAARYAISKNVQLAFEAKNLTDQVYYKYAGRSNLNAQYESYGRTYALTLKVTSF
jgi:TonB-dependent receptor